MLTNLKICGGAALSLLISALVITPIDAKPVSQVTPSASHQIAQLDNDESINKVVYPVGIVRTIEGNMVTIQLTDGQMMVYQASPEDIETWVLYTGSYVLVDRDNNKILDTVYEGEIKSIVGSVVTVELKNNGKLEKYGVDRGTLGAMNLIEGQDVYVTKSEILALAPEPDLNTEAYLINNTRPVGSYQETQIKQTQTPTQQRVENNQSETQMNQMYQQPDTSETQTNEPVRGMW